MHAYVCKYTYVYLHMHTQYAEYEYATHLNTNMHYAIRADVIKV